MEKSFEYLLESVLNKLSSWYDTFVNMLPNMMVAFLVVCLFAFLGLVVKRLLAKGIKRISDNESLNLLAVRLIYFLFLGLGVVIALDLLKLDRTVTSLLAGVGVIGLALGFAFQETAANFISGVFLAIKRPYKVGQIIKVGDAWGEVIALELRTTTIRTWNGPEVIIPNKELFQGKITNFSTFGFFRIDIKVGVSYGDDLDKAASCVKRALDKIDIRDKGREVGVYFEEFGNSSINMVAHLWIPYPSSPGFFEARDQAIKNIKHEFDQNDITIPFPIRTLDFGIKGGQRLDQVMTLNQNE